MRILAFRLTYDWDNLLRFKTFGPIQLNMRFRHPAWRWRALWCWFLVMIRDSNYGFQHPTYSLLCRISISTLQILTFISNYFLYWLRFPNSWFFLSTYGFWPRNSWILLSIYWPAHPKTKSVILHIFKNIEIMTWNNSYRKGNNKLRLYIINRDRQTDVQ